jgi:serine/threonine protein kinase
MVAGRRPFGGASALELMSAILRDDPPPLAAPGPLGGIVDGVVRRCLEKRPDDRFQSAKDFAYAQNNRLYRSRVDLATGHRTPLRQLGPQFVDGVDGLSSLELSADGASYCYSYKRDISDLYVVSGLQ